ncbi:hypothetical protein [Paenibacillus alkalitolerans]|uniref:hypothetical protein n=1 Tax=Paenibacillus alkalitolerans TaxID=2799335 RepID=UPI0018F59985|nr:hypothetical protein [Paenibacillus alkalitolerans]
MEKEIVLGQTKHSGDGDEEAALIERAQLLHDAKQAEEKGLQALERLRDALSPLHDEADQ